MGDNLKKLKQFKLPASQSLQHQKHKNWTWAERSKNFYLLTQVFTSRSPKELKRFFVWSAQNDELHEKKNMFMRDDPFYNRQPDILNYQIIQLKLNQSLSSHIYSV